MTDRYFAADPAQRRVARELYAAVAALPIVSPHGHVDPRLFGDPDATFGTPADVFVLHDHYILRMLHSQGIPYEVLAGPDHRRVWQVFADNQRLFRGTPSGAWLSVQLADVFGTEGPLGSANAHAVYDEIESKLATPAFHPRALFERFHIETLCTTDDAADPLDAHRAIRASGWSGDVRPTLRADGVVNLRAPGWRGRFEALAAAVGREITTTAALIAAIEERRAAFTALGAVATDVGVETAYTGELEPAEADGILRRALRGQASADDAQRFAGHLLIELARMSVEDGLVIQIHVGSFRDHDAALLERFGPDMGADIPVATELTQNLRPLLARFGNDPRLRLIVFTLDEAVYSRELAPLAGYYPALTIGPPWWFHDSLNGIDRYLDAVVETAGIANLAGFNDDARSFCSIPARHDLWRRATADWLAGLVVRHVVDEASATEMSAELASGLARRAYRLDDAHVRSSGRPVSRRSGA
jgi:glucuronate isomerase